MTNENSKRGRSPEKEVPEVWLEDKADTRGQYVQMELPDMPQPHPVVRKPYGPD